MCATLAGAEPWWEPGTWFGYHAMSWSTPSRKPTYGHFGVPVQHVNRVARQIPADGAVLAAPDPATTSGIRHDAAYANRIGRAFLAQMAAVSNAGTAFGYSPFRPGTREGSTFGMVGMTGSGAYADIDSGVVVALMRIDQIVADALG